MFRRGMGTMGKPKTRVLSLFPPTRGARAGCPTFRDLCGSFSFCKKGYLCRGMSQPQRYIAHFDLDAFFVSVECLNDPSLKGLPLLVGGRERGVVAACSYEARKYGIHSAMPMKTALKLCPHAIVTNNSRGDYSKYSRIVTNIIAEKAPLFEKASID